MFSRRRSWSLVISADFVGAGGYLLVERDDCVVGVEDGLQGGEDGGASLGVGEEQAELVFGLVDEADVIEVVVALADFEVGGFAGLAGTRKR